MGALSFIPNFLALSIYLASESHVLEMLKFEVRDETGATRNWLKWAETSCNHNI